LILKYKPDFTNAYYYRGLFYGLLKEYEKSIDDLTTSIKLKTDRTNVYVYRGAYEYSLGQKEKACEDFYKAKELGDTTSIEYIEKYCLERNDNK
jgi:tetratricopeptide (TPR) repeat protein